MAADSDEIIRQLTEKLNLTGSAAEEVSRNLSMLAKSSASNATAATAEAAARASVTKSYDSLKQGTNQFTGTLGSVASNLGGLTSSVANSKDAFTAINPILDMTQSVLKSTIEVFGQLGAAAVGWIPGFGSSMAKVSEATAKTASKATDIIFGAVKQQIAGTQKLVNDFTKLSQAGLTFGGSLETAKRYAGSFGLSLETFSSIASKNAESLAALRGNAELGAGAVAKMTKQLGPGLVGLYGNFENLGSAVADYMVSQTNLGRNAVTDQKALQEGAKNYLITQKELSNLTGKSAEALKKDQEARSKVAAFQMAMGEKSITEQNNINAALAQVQAKYGDAAAKQLMEKVALNGDILSESGQKFRAFNTAQSNVIDQIYNNLGKGEADFKRSQAEIFEANAANVKLQNESNRDLLKFNAAGYLGEFGTMLNDTASASIKSMSAQQNAISAQQAALAETEKLMKTQNTLIGGTVTALEDFKIQIEDLTVKNLNKTALYLEAAYKAADVFAKGLDKVNNVIDFLITGDVSNLAKALGIIDTGGGGGSGQGNDPNRLMKNTTMGAAISALDLSNEGSTIMDAAREGANTVANRVDKLVNSRTETVAPARKVISGQVMGQGQTVEISEKTAKDQDPIALMLKKAGYDTENKRADGGIAYGPTLTGENGPEAHIPLKGSNIPLNIDFGPLIRVMEDQAQLTQDLIDEVRSSKDVQEQILNASY